MSNGCINQSRGAAGDVARFLDKGFVVHKAMLVSALSRALASRVMLMDLTIGRKGLLGYLKALGGSNVIKVIPLNGSASGSQATGKRLKKP